MLGMLTQVLTTTDDQQTAKRSNTNGTTRLFERNIVDVVNDFKQNLNNLTDNELNFIESNLYKYDEQVHRAIEEKDKIIEQLERGLRAASQTETNIITSTIAEELVHKDNKIDQLNKQLIDYENEIFSLKILIKQQEDIILQHNNNIYELTNTKDAIIKGKQEAFKVQNDELNRKQKIIDDQQAMIDSLKTKIENLEETFELNKIDLEKRLTDREEDLKQKIDAFEMNLHYGRKYFEEILDEKEQIINQKRKEIDDLKFEFTKKCEDNQLITQNNSNQVINNLKQELAGKYAEIDQLKQQHALEINQLCVANQLNTYTDEYYRHFQSKITELNTDIELKVQTINKLKEELTSKDQQLSEKDKTVITLENQLSLSGSKLNESKQIESSMKKLKEKFDIDLKNMKELHDHQIELNRCKINMLEKTIENYQRAYNDLSKSSDAIVNFDSSSSIYKGIIDEIQKLNAKLETEKIDLEVKCNQLSEQITRLEQEKENLNKKYQAADQERQRYVNERDAYNLKHMTIVKIKDDEIETLNDTLRQLNENFTCLEEERNNLLVVKSEYEQLQVTYAELTKQYQQLYDQANELINTNQVINNELNLIKRLNDELNLNLSESKMKVEHLENENAELNRLNIGYELKLKDLNEQFEVKINEVNELNVYKRELVSINELNSKIERLTLEVDDKNELIEQLNKAKDFLETTNSQLLTKNIRMQLYLENMGVNVEHVEKSRVVKEYDDLKQENGDLKQQLDSLKTLSNEYETIKASFNEINTKNTHLEKILNEYTSKNAELDDNLIELREKLDKLTNDLNEKCDNEKKLKQELSQLNIAYELKLNECNHINNEFDRVLEKLNKSADNSKNESEINILNDLVKSELKLLENDLNVYFTSKNIEIGGFKSQLSEKIQECDQMKQELNELKVILSVNKQQKQHQQLTRTDQQINIESESSETIIYDDDRLEVSMRYNNKISECTSLQEQNQYYYSVFNAYQIELNNRAYQIEALNYEVQNLRLINPQQITTPSINDNNEASVQPNVESATDNVDAKQTASVQQEKINFFNWSQVEHVSSDATDTSNINRQDQIILPTTNKQEETNFFDWSTVQKTSTITPAVQNNIADWTQLAQPEQQLSINQEQSVQQPQQQWTSGWSPHEMVQQQHYTNNIEYYKHECDQLRASLDEKLSIIDNLNDKIIELTSSKLETQNNNNNNEELSKIKVKLSEYETENDCLSKRVVELNREILNLTQINQNLFDKQAYNGELNEFKVLYEELKVNNEHNKQLINDLYDECSRFIQSVLNADCQNIEFLSSLNELVEKFNQIKEMIAHNKKQYENLNVLLEDKSLNIEHLMNKNEQLREDYKQLECDLDELTRRQIELQAIINDLNLKLNSKESQFDELSSNYTQLNLDLDRFKVNYDLLKKKAIVFKEKLKSYEPIDNCSLSDSSLNEANEEVNFEDIEFLKQQNNDYKKQIDLLKQNFETKLSEYQVIDIKYKDNLNELDSLKKKYDTIKAKAHMFKEKLKKYEQHDEVSTQQQQRLEQQTFDVQVETVTQLNTSPSNVIDKDSLIEEFKTKNVNLENEINVLNKKLVDSEESFRQYLNNIEQLNENLNSLLSEKEELNRKNEMIVQLNVELKQRNDNSNEIIKLLEEKLNKSVESKTQVESEFEKLQQKALKMKAIIKGLKTSKSTSSSRALTPTHDFDEHSQQQLTVQVEEAHQSHLNVSSITPTGFGEYNELKEENNRLKEQIETVRVEVNAKQDQLVKLNNLYEELKIENDDLRQWLSNSEANSQSQEVLKSENATLSNDIDTIKQELNVKNEELLRVNYINQELRLENENLKQHIDSIEANSTNEALEEIDSLKHEIEVLIKSVNLKEEELTRLNNIDQDLKIENEKLKQLNANLEANLNNEAKEKANYKLELDKLHEKALKMKAIIKTLKSNKTGSRALTPTVDYEEHQQQLTVQVDDLSHQHQQQNLLTASLTPTDFNSAEMNKKLDEVKDENIRIKQELETIKHEASVKYEELLVLYKTLESRYDELRTENDNLMQTIQSLSNEAREKDNLKIEFDKLQEKALKMRAVIKSLKSAKSVGGTRVLTPTQDVDEQLHVDVSLQQQLPSNHSPSTANAHASLRSSMSSVDYDNVEFNKKLEELKEENFKIKAELESIKEETNKRHQELVVLNNNLDHLNVQLREENDYLKQQRTDDIANIKFDENNRLRYEIETIRQELNVKNEELSRVNYINQELRQKIDSIEANSNNEALEEIDSLKHEIEVLIKSVNLKEEELTRLNNIDQDLKIENEKLKQLNANLEANLNNEAKEKANYKLELDKLHEKALKMKAIIKTLKSNKTGSRALTPTVDYEEHQQQLTVQVDDVHHQPHLQHQHLLTSAITPTGSEASETSKKFDDVKIENDNLKHEISEIKQELNSKDEELIKLSSIYQELKLENDNLKQSIRNLEISLNTEIQEKANYKTELDKLQEKALKLKSKIKSAKDSKSANKARANSQSSSIAEVATEETHHEPAISPESQVITELESKLDEIKALNLLIEQLKDENLKHKESINSLELLYNEMNTNKTNEIFQIKSNYEVKMKELTEKCKILETISNESEIHESNEQINRIESKYNELIKAKDIEIIELNEQLDKLRKIVLKSDQNYVDLNEGNEVYKSLNEKLADYEQTIKNLETENENLRQDSLKKENLPHLERIKEVNVTGDNTGWGDFNENWEANEDQEQQFDDQIDSEKKAGDDLVASEIKVETSSQLDAAIIYQTQIDSLKAELDAKLTIIDNLNSKLNEFNSLIATIQEENENLRQQNLKQHNLPHLERIREVKEGDNVDVGWGEFEKSEDAIKIEIQNETGPFDVNESEEAKPIEDIQINQAETSGWGDFNDNWEDQTDEITQAQVEAQEVKTETIENNSYENEILKLNENLKEKLEIISNLNENLINLTNEISLVKNENDELKQKLDKYQFEEVERVNALNNEILSMKNESDKLILKLQEQLNDNECLRRQLNDRELKDENQVFDTPEYEQQEVQHEKIENAWNDFNDDWSEAVKQENNKNDESRIDDVEQQKQEAINIENNDQINKLKIDLNEKLAIIDNLNNKINELNNEIEILVVKNNDLSKQNEAFQLEDVSLNDTIILLNENLAKLKHDYNELNEKNFNLKEQLESFSEKINSNEKEISELKFDNENMRNTIHDYEIKQVECGTHDDLFVKVDEQKLQQHEPKQSQQVGDDETSVLLNPLESQLSATNEIERLKNENYYLNASLTSLHQQGQELINQCEGRISELISENENLKSQIVQIQQSQFNQDPNGNQLSILNTAIEKLENEIRQSKLDNEQLIQDINQLKSQNETFMEIELLNNNLNERVNQLQADISDKCKKLNVLEAEKESLESRINDYELKLAEFEQANLNIQIEYEKKLTNLTNELENLEKLNENKLTSFESDIKIHDTQKEEFINELKVQNEFLNGEKDALNVQINELNAKLHEITIDNESLTNELNEIKIRKNELQSERDTLYNEINELKLRIDELRLNNEKYEADNQNLMNYITSVQDAIAQTNQMIYDRDVTIEQLRQEITSYQQIANKQENEQQKQKEDEKIFNSNEKLAELEAKTNELQSENVTLKVKINELKLDYENLIKLTDDEILMLNRNVDAFKEKLNQFESEKENLLSENNGLKESISNYQYELKLNEEKMNEKLIEIEQLKKLNEHLHHQQQQQQDQFNANEQRNDVSSISTSVISDMNSSEQQLHEELALLKQQYISLLNDENCNDVSYLKNKCFILEEQLRKSRLICEKVVKKLEKLRIQNENFNERLKTMKTMMIIK